jgi:hypothetical protein
MVGVSAGTTGRVVIAVDPHKGSWTAAAVDDRLQSLTTIRVGVSPRGLSPAAALRRTLARRRVGH